MGATGRGGATDAVAPAAGTSQTSPVARLDPDVRTAPDAFIFDSLPGAGEILAPDLLVKFGDDRRRFPSAASVQALAGTCPVTEGQVYIAGYTMSTNFPFTRGAFGTILSGREDVFVTRLNPQGGVSDVVYSTYLGGQNFDEGYGLVVDNQGTAYVAGRTDSSEFPVTPGAYDTTFDGTYCGSYPCEDGFIAKLATGYTTIGGRVTDAQGQPIANVTVTASAAANTAQVTTNSSSGYDFKQLLPGTYTVTVTGNYFWTPAQRVISVPPDAASQDFVGSHIVKHSALDPQTPAPFGTPITYTLNVIASGADNFSVIDVVPTHTIYVSRSLISAPAGLTYDAAANAVSGTLNLSAGQAATITFTTQVAITSTETFGPSIINRACVRAAGAPFAQCEWSNTVVNYTRLTFVYLPVMLR